MFKHQIFIIFMFALIFLQGCTSARVGTGVATTTMVVAEGERSIGTVVDDATIKLNLSANFLKSNKHIFLNINSNVINGRVLLTGIVDDQETRIEAIKKTWEVEGVNEVVNEIDIGKKTTIKEYASDLWINTQVKSLAAKTLGLRFLGYNFETIRGKVYIAGITSRPEQLENTIFEIKNIKGVKEIVNYVVLVQD